MLTYLKCEWCDRNASDTVRLNTGKLTGICFNHLQTVPTRVVAGNRVTVNAKRAS